MSINSNPDLLKISSSNINNVYGLPQASANCSVVSVNDIPVDKSLVDDRNRKPRFEIINRNNEFMSRQTSFYSEGSFIKKQNKPVLPDYLLDFGHVILGTVKTHVIRAANMGKILASFEIERQNASKTGFIIDLEKVKNLPNEESVEFVITFDPRGANLGLGAIEHVIPLYVCIYL